MKSLGLKGRGDLSLAGGTEGAGRGDSGRELAHADADAREERDGVPLLRPHRSVVLRHPPPPRHHPSPPPPSAAARDHHRRPQNQPPRRLEPWLLRRRRLLLPLLAAAGTTIGWFAAGVRSPGSVLARHNDDSSGSSSSSSKSDESVVAAAIHQEGCGHGGGRNEEEDRAGPVPVALLALLYPPGLQGGYRNQVLRFAALCRHALRRNQALFLPSLWWTTQRIRPRQQESLLGTEPTRGHNGTDDSSLQWYPVPMDLLFDVDAWNEYARSHPKSLPMIVRELPERENSAHDSDCWTRRPSPDPSGDFLMRELQGRGHLGPVEDWTAALIAWPPPDRVVAYHPRRDDLLPLVSRCQRPHVHGGGRGAGRLWNEYLAMVNSIRETPPANPVQGAAVVGGGAINATAPPSYRELPAVLASVLQALRPLPAWTRMGMEDCIGPAAAGGPRRTDRDPGEGAYRYAALHARIEPEMLAHACGRDMDRNLSRIVSRVADLLDARVLGGAPGSPTSHSSGIPLFVAVSRSGLVDPRFPKFEATSRTNLNTLDELVTGRPLRDRYPVVECGAEMLRRYRARRVAARTGTDPDGGPAEEQTADRDAPFYGEDEAVDGLGTLLEQVINFDLAVRAEIFVGVERSSYSNAVWTTRYLLGVRENYKYTSSGLEPVPGMPPPHSNCDRPKKRTKNKA